MATTKKKRPKVERDTGSIGEVAPSVRTQTDWTPTRIRSIIRQVEQGDLNQAGTLCDWILTDDRVKSTLAARLDALFGLVPTFDAGVGRRAKQAVKAIEAGEDWWAAYPAAQLRKMHGWGILLGVSLLRSPWSVRPDKGGRALPRLVFWHPSCLKQDQKTGQWFARDANNTLHEVVAGDGEWILHTPFGPERPWGEGEWRVLALLVLAKSYANTDWSRHGEKAAILVAESEQHPEIPGENTKEHRAELCTDLANMGGKAAVVLRDRFKLKILEVTANTRQIYEAQINLINEAIAVVIRGGNLSTVTKEGSHAAAEQQAKTSDTPKLAFDAGAVTDTIHDQSLTWWADLNFGDAQLAPWPNYPVEPEEDKAAKADTVNTIADAVTKFDALGYEIDTDALVDEYDIPWLGERLSREERAALAPSKPGGDDADNEDDDVDPDAKGKKPPKAKGFLASLASGASTKANRGFIEGQLYADALVEHGAADATKAIKPTLDRMIDVLDEATDYDDARERLRAMFQDDVSPEDLSDLVYKVMVVAELAGRRAVTQDS